MPLFMHKRLALALTTAVGAALLANAALAAGTAADAKAMLDKTAAALSLIRQRRWTRSTRARVAFWSEIFILSASI